jgi:hypothetical protein
MAITSGVCAPRAQITIGGQSFGVLSATVDQEATRRSSTMVATCALNSFPGGDAFFAGLSDNKGGVTIDDLQVVDGEWNDVSINYETTIVSLKGQDGSIVLHQKKSSEKFNNQKRSEIVNTIAQRNGFQAQVTAANLMAGKLFQIDWAKLTDGVSDAAILHKLAELSGARWWVKNGTLYFKGKGDISSSYTVHYHAGNPSSGDFISLEILLNLQAAKTIEVNVNSWNQKKKQTFISQKRILGMSGPLIYNYRTPGLEQDHVDDLATNKAAEHARHEVEIQVTLVGDPTIDVGMGLQLVGTAFAGTYEMDHIAHTISEHGYMMAITAKSARAGRGSDSGSSTPPNEVGGATTGGSGGGSTPGGSGGGATAGGSGGGATP